MAKPRKQTYTLQMYLQKVKELDIRSDQDVQRLSGAWNNNMLNELIATVLNDGYIPPIILGEEANSQMWIIDGLQRSTALMMFRYGNYRITSSIEEPAISYRAKVRDAEGEVCIDGNGDIVWEDKEFDLRHKGYSKLPEELQKKFNEYQIETVIHEGYGMKEISKLVRRYNNHKAMNVSQKAFTFVDNYARKIREILKKKFFIECTGYTKNERKNGTLERIIMESIMCMFHLDNWKKPGQIGAYINENSSMEEFNILEDCMERLESVITDGLYGIFTSRDSFLWFTLFNKFTCLGLDDREFAGFLHAFKNGLCDKEVDGKVFYEKGRSLKDRAVVVEKLDLLETLMLEYLHVSREDLEGTDVLGFIRENVNPDAAQEDICLYKDMLDDFVSKVDSNSGLLDRQNRASLTAIIAYACRADIQIDEWFVDYFSRTGDYLSDQQENYLYMKEDLGQFLEVGEVAEVA